MPQHIHARYQIVPGRDLTIDVYGADGTKLRVRGRLDAAPDGYGDVRTRIVIKDAVAQVLED